jgi:hypothetical protein
MDIQCFVGQLCIKHPSIELLQLLIPHYENAMKEGRAIFTLLSSVKNEKAAAETLEWLIQRGAYIGQPKTGFPKDFLAPIVKAVQGPFPRLVEILLEHGANPNVIIDEIHQTPLIATSQSCILSRAANGQRDELSFKMIQVAILMRYGANLYLPFEYQPVDPESTIDGLAAMIKGTFLDFLNDTGYCYDCARFRSHTDGCLHVNALKAKVEKARMMMGLCSAQIPRLPMSTPIAKFVKTDGVRMLSTFYMFELILRK